MTQVDLQDPSGKRAAIRQRENVLHTDNWLEEHLGFAGKGFYPCPFKSIFYDG